MKLSHRLISKVGITLLVRRKHTSYIKAIIKAEIFVQSILLMFKVISIDKVESYPLLDTLLLYKHILLINYFCNSKNIF